MNKQISKRFPDSSYWTPLDAAARCEGVVIDDGKAVEQMLSSRVQLCADAVQVGLIRAGRQ